MTTQSTLGKSTINIYFEVRMVKKRTIYTASDGKEFDNEKEAEEHDKKVI